MHLQLNYRPEPNDTLMKFYFLMFVFSVVLLVIHLFLWTTTEHVIVQDCLDSEGIQRLVWPVRSPDLNPIENVWDALGKQVASRNYPPTNKNTLIRALTEEWDKFPQQLLDNVVQSMVRRVECCITLHGGHIPY
ncbi:transposable element Tcb1 transposase [Trichonephila clavipes]|nr:transposable element Tcb1 transposase [Trichonephila clavipes]